MRVCACATDRHQGYDSSPYKFDCFARYLHVDCVVEALFFGNCCLLLELMDIVSKVAFSSAVLTFFEFGTMRRELRRAPRLPVRFKMISSVLRPGYLDCMMTEQLSKSCATVASWLSILPKGMAGR